MLIIRISTVVLLILASSFVGYGQLKSKQLRANEPSPETAPGAIEWVPWLLPTKPFDKSERVSSAPSINLTPLLDRKEHRDFEVTAEAHRCVDTKPYTIVLYQQAKQPRCLAADCWLQVGRQLRVSQFHKKDTFVLKRFAGTLLVVCWKDRAQNAEFVGPDQIASTAHALSASLWFGSAVKVIIDYKR